MKIYLLALQICDVCKFKLPAQQASNLTGPSNNNFAGRIKWKAAWRPAASTNLLAAGIEKIEQLHHIGMRQHPHDLQLPILRKSSNGICRHE